MKPKPPGGSDRKIVILSILVWLCGGFGTLEAEEWTSIRDDQERDIRIFCRSHSSGNVEFKGVTHVESRLSGLVALFADAENIPKWVYRTSSVSVLKKIEKTEAVVHTIHSMPWPLRPRDAVVRSRLEQDPKSLIVTIRGRAVPDYIDVDEQYVRITQVESQWTFRPMPPGKTIEVTFQGYGEPGGEVLSSIHRSPVFRWLVKSFLWRLPYETMKNMKTIVRQPKYQNKAFTYIQEP